MIEINFGDHRKGVVDRFPNECPYCHKIISPILITHNKSSKGVELIFSCSNQQCQKAFIGFYASEQLNNFNLFDVSIGEVKDVVFSENIICISPSFSKIYNQANFAEQNKLYEICGVGYRKALEFLIKDFLIMKNPENEKSIKIKALGKCISEDIEDVRIKMVG